MLKKRDLMKATSIASIFLIVFVVTAIFFNFLENNKDPMIFNVFFIALLIEDFVASEHHRLLKSIKTSFIISCAVFLPYGMLNAAFELKYYEFATIYTLAILFIMSYLNKLMYKNENQEQTD
jgi:hypothetical protein